MWFHILCFRLCIISDLLAQAHLSPDQQLDRIFQHAGAIAPCVVFIDDAHVIFPLASSVGDQEISSLPLLLSFSKHMEGICSGVFLFVFLMERLVVTLIFL
jgi:hypothetical protein